MGWFDRLFGKDDSKERRRVPGAGVVHDRSGSVVYNLLDPMMKQFMGRCIGAVKKAGIKAKGSDQFSILLGDDIGAELPLDTFWTRFQDSQDDDVFDSVVELARRMTQTGPQPTVENLYPYVIPESYLAHQETEPGGIVRPLGHGLHVGLVFDLQGLVESLNADGLRRLGMKPEQAHARAIKNLQALARAQHIKMGVFPKGPTGKPFVLVGGHWAAATAILLPSLKELVEGPLASRDILASIPHREAMLLFPMGNRRDREGFREMIREKEGDKPKPLTFDFFRLTNEGVKTFQEAE